MQKIRRKIILFLCMAVIFAQCINDGTKTTFASETWQDTNLVKNGEFENGSKDWLVETGITSDQAYIAVVGEKNTTNAYHYWSENGDYLSLSQKISQLPEGTYKVAVMAMGKVSDLSLRVDDMDASVKLNDTEWEEWENFQTNSFQINQTRDITIRISGNIQAGNWGNFDRIILYRLNSEEELLWNRLQKLKEQIPKNYDTMGFTKKMTEDLSMAETKADACTRDSTKEELQEAYDQLEKAISDLKFYGDLELSPIEQYDFNESIRGADISSYISLMDSFDEVNKTADSDSLKKGFRNKDGRLLDQQEFFDQLANSGINYVRLRVWNNPYNQNGDGYGGGNSDFSKALEMGKYATRANMRVLIDFHFSDFWADPGKQKTPKEWENISFEEKKNKISSYVKERLTELIDAGVDVGMVQIGNETTQAFCGESDWDKMNQLFDAGCDAIHEFNQERKKDILSVLHFTNPEKANHYNYIAEKLADYDGDQDGKKEGVSYDVFASSYYPYWHGTMDNLKNVLTEIADKYQKYVMVAETSWANTLKDGDGHANTIANQDALGNYVNYDISVQGQANEIHDVADAVNSIDVTLDNGKKAGLGMFYWEPAWIPIQNVYNEKGEFQNHIYEENKFLWEKYGSGWASSYAGKYDSEDAGKYYGGSAVDNQALFDFEGKPLDSLNTFKYMAYGVSKERNPEESSTETETSTEMENSTETETSAEVESSTEQETSTEEESSTEQEISTEPETGTEESGTETESSTESETSTGVENSTEAETSIEIESSTEPEADTEESGTETESSTEAETSTEIESSTEPEANTEETSMDSETSREVESSTEAETSTEIESSTEPETSTEPEAGTEVESSTEQETSVETESSTEPETSAEEESSTEAETSTEIESSAEPETSTEEESSTEVETSTEIESSTGKETSTEEESSTEPEAGTEESGTETESSTESETSTEVESSTESEAETGTEAETNTKSEVNTEPETSRKIETTTNRADVSLTETRKQEEIVTDCNHTKVTSQQPRKKGSLVKKKKNGFVFVYRIEVNTKKDKKVSLLKVNRTRKKSIKIPDVLYIDGKKYKIQTIKKNAFKDCKNLQTLSLGKYVEKIEYHAFYKNKKLQRVILKGSKLKKTIAKKGKNYHRSARWSFKK